jgi:hypothetical protein
MPSTNLRGRVRALGSALGFDLDRKPSDLRVRAEQAAAAAHEAHAAQRGEQQRSSAPDAAG